MKLIKNHTYMKSLMLVSGTGIIVFLLCLSFFSSTRSLYRDTPSLCSLLRNNNLDRDLEGKWIMQGSNLWFMNGFTDIQVDSYFVNNDLIFEWKGFYSYLFMPFRFFTRIKTTEGNNLSLSIISQNLITKLFFPELTRPLHVIAYEKDNYLIFYDCGGALMAEGGLYALTRHSNNSILLDNFHSFVLNLSAKHQIDSVFYTVIPQQETGSSVYFKLIGQNGWRVFLAVTLLLILLTHLMPLHVTMLNSFSYTTLIHWNFGTYYFNIQTILMYAYHQTFLAMFSHATVLSDLLLWYTVISTNAKYFLGTMPAALILSGVISVQVLQLLSFKDMRFLFITSPIYAAMGSVAFYFMDDFYYSSCFVLILTGILRMIGHVPEPIPPFLSGDTNFIYLDKIPFTRKLCIPILMTAGIISESTVGMPCRGFSYIFYLILCHFGYTSKNLISVEECRGIHKVVKKIGWEGSPLLMKAMEGEHGWLFD